MAESNRKCSRLGEWFVQEEIARAIDTALETIIGLSKRKQFKYHGGESLFALDFHTEGHTSSSLQTLFSPPRSILERRVDTGIASLSAESLPPCVRRVISKWFVIQVESVPRYSMCVCVFVSLLGEYEVLKRNVHKQKLQSRKKKKKSLLFKTLFSSVKWQNSAGCPFSHSLFFHTCAQLSLKARQKIS